MIGLVDVLSWDCTEIPEIEKKSISMVWCEIVLGQEVSSKNSLSYICHDVLEFEGPVAEGNWVGGCSIDWDGSPISG